MRKEHILQESRRTAEANGGVPLGWRRFVTETGIKESDWFGKFWARWSDALREAGFLPNQLQGAYAAAELLEKYAELARELRRLPAKGDLRLKAQADSDFPNDKTFARLGSKAQLIARLVEYCHGRPGYEDVSRLGEQYAPHTAVKTEEPISEGFEVGVVYLLKSGRFYKIGRTNAAGRREYELGLQLPEKVTTVHVIRTDDPVGIEAYWHQRFESKRKKGEWFGLTGQDVTAFKRRKFM